MKIIKIELSKNRIDPLHFLYFFISVEKKKTNFKENNIYVTCDYI